ncbi:fibronectin type III domain-containing protein [Kribbella sp. CA-247076]|uniref:fibronectin type III domain-containing protein n=1 Tax=Kribbella sp. CA-247076 TaxID=3239941 RepID=UPI003D8E1608
MRETRRARAGLAAVVAGCIALTSVVVLTGAGSADSGLSFSQSGHWVYNSMLGRVFHLDGATRNVDADVRVESAEPGAQVVQSDRNGYVLSRSRIDQFGKSDLTVAEPIQPPADEQPVGLEAAGAAFAVYPKAGHVLRLGERQAAVFPGGPLGDPVVTSDGTLWVHRVDHGDLCQLPLGADRMSCPAAAPKGHRGALTAFGTEAMFVDLTARQVYRLTSDGIDDRTGLGSVAVPDDALVAGNDVDGRLALVDRDRGVVHLVDVPAEGKKPAATISRPIKPGKYDRIASTGHGLALLDRENEDLLTLGPDGTQTSHQKVSSQAVPGERKRPPNLVRGEDSRVYVESGKGDRVVVVDRDGRAEAVEVGPGKPTPTPTPNVTPPERTPQQPNVPPPPRSTTTPPPQKVEPPSNRPTNQVTAEPGRPGAPTAVQARLVNGSATVTWRPAAAHGAAVTSYRLSWTGGSRTVSGTTTSTRITGLDEKTAYYFTIRAVNRVGSGPAVRSNRVQFTWAVAASPGGLRVKSNPSSGTLVLGWTRPQLNQGTFVRYDVTMGGRTRMSTTEQVTWTGLTDGTRYTFSVRAITRSPDGRTLIGSAAGLTAAPQVKERVIASRGASAEYEECTPPDCAFVLVRIENLRPNTKYEIKPWASRWGNFNPGATLTTDAKGNMVVDDRFPCGAVGQTVWVTVEAPDGTTYTSNRFVWTSG